MEYKKLHRELWVFFVFLGLLLGAGATWLILGDIARDAPKLWGYQRHLAVGVPLAVIAGGYLVSGILFAMCRIRIFCVMGAVVSMLLTGFYVVFMIDATGQLLGFNLISLVMWAIPVLVWARAIQFMKMTPPRTITKS